MWVAKFEASNNGSNKVQVKPGVISWRGITINDMYQNAIDYNPDMNSHMMKNSEWGAVAYLAHSKYGRNGSELTVANSNYYTGGANSITAYASTYVGESTTGNPYGIYDMSVNGWEYQAAYYDDGSAIPDSLSNIANAPNHLKQIYTEYSERYFGDAIWETSSQTSTKQSSWFGDYSNFMSDMEQPITRGGYLGTDNITGAGLFSFSYSSAATLNERMGFRVIMIQ